MRRPSFIARQAGRPAGVVGRLLLGLMARETSRFNSEVLDALAAQDGERILEIGFGHGRALFDVARRAPGAQLGGIDVSATAERAASRRCRSLVSGGRLDLRTGDAGAMPWDANSFDVAFSVHTIYFWPEPANVFTEIRRVLRPGGRFIVGMRERSEAALAAFPASTYRFYSSEEVAHLLSGVGFEVVENRTAEANAELRILIGRAR